MLGTERHESRRIDNQLRGRSGRQGDPGRSKFFLSLEDDLMRIFGSDKLDGMLTKLGLKENEAIVHPWINKALEKAQQKVEARNFDIRKNILKFDNVMNDQRKVIFDQRIEWMTDDGAAEIVTDMRHAVIEDLVAKHVPENAYPEQWDVAGLKEELKRVLGLDLPVDEWAKEEGIADEELLARIERRADEHMAAKVAQWGPDVLRYVEKSILLQTLDHLWREHLVMLEHLRQVIGLRGYGQRDPLNEYKAEAFNLFEAMSQNLREAVTAQLMRVEIVQQPPEAARRSCRRCRPRTSIRSTGEDELALAAAGAADAGARTASRRSPPPSAIRTIRRAGARSAATRPARAARARNTSTATAATRSAPDVRITAHETKSPGDGPAIFVCENLNAIDPSGSPTSGCRSCRPAPPALRRSSAGAGRSGWRRGAGRGARAAGASLMRRLRGAARLLASAVLTGAARAASARIAPCERRRWPGRAAGFGLGAGAAAAVAGLRIGAAQADQRAPCGRCALSLPGLSAAGSSSFDENRLPNKLPLDLAGRLGRAARRARRCAIRRGAARRRDVGAGATAVHDRRVGEFGDARRPHGGRNGSRRRRDQRASRRRDADLVALHRGDEHRMHAAVGVGADRRDRRAAADQLGDLDFVLALLLAAPRRRSLPALR